MPAACAKGMITICENVLHDWLFGVGVGGLESSNCFDQERDLLIVYLGEGSGTNHFVEKLDSAQITFD